MQQQCSKYIKNDICKKCFIKFSLVISIHTRCHGALNQRFDSITIINLSLILSEYFFLVCMALSGYNCINYTNWYSVMINKLRKNMITYAILGGQMIFLLPPTFMPEIPTSHPVMTSLAPNRNLKPGPFRQLSNILLFCFRRPS